MRRFLRQLRHSKAARIARVVQARVATRRLGTAGASPWLRRGVLAVTLLGVALIPYPVLADQPSSPGCHHGCRGQGELNMLRWTEPLVPDLGSWTVSTGLAGTSPASGQAYVAVSNGIAAIGTGLTVTAYTENGGSFKWTRQITGLAAGAQIVSVRTWPDEVTAGVVTGTARTEVVFDGASGSITGEYPSTLFGGAVGGSQHYTVIVGPDGVISYDNLTQKARWKRATRSATQAWRSDGTYLYLTQAAGGYLSGGLDTGLLRIDIATGAQQILAGDGTGFAGSLTAAYDSVVLFTSSAGTTAYAGDTGLRLWSIPGAVPEGYDPLRSRIYLSGNASLLAVDPLTGRARTVSDGSGGTYVIRDGVALGLDLGQGGDAWGYDLGAQRVAFATSRLDYLHYFSDLSGVGGSADPTGSIVVFTACGRIGTPTAAPSSSGLLSSPPASPSPSATPSLLCAQPELVAVGL